MYSLDYVHEKLFIAICVLATGQGDARSRVDAAYHEFWHLNENDFPKRLRKTRREIEVLLTRLPGRQGYIIPDNIKKMKNKTASKIASKILDLYCGVSRELDERNT